MLKSDLKLFLLSCSSLAVIILLPINRQWVNNKIVSYYKEFRIQIQNSSKEYKFRYRFGDNYVFNKNLSDFLKNDNDIKPVVFLPPKAYLKHHNSKYDYGETLSFYYFTGIKPVDLSSQDYRSATHALIADGPNVRVIPIQSDTVREQIIREYRKYSE